MGNVSDQQGQEVGMVRGVPRERQRRSSGSHTGRRKVVFDCALKGFIYQSGNPISKGKLQPVTIRFLEVRRRWVGVLGFFCWCETLNRNGGGIILEVVHQLGHTDLIHMYRNLRSVGTYLLSCLAGVAPQPCTPSGP